MIGQVIDVYRVTKKLGQGGMGSVFEAIDTQLHRPVALKVMNIEDDDMFVKRFRAEAQALARLDHPNIVKIFGLRETKLGLVIIMEYVEGKTWSDYVAEGKFKSPQDTINITNQLLDALSYAHRQGIIHRDIKPSNIMITDDGTVKVTDFGLAKLVDPQATMAQNPLTQVGQAVGSLFYMSPEQVRGLNTVDHRTDLYSSGITMYEVLAGRPPFDDQTMTTPYVIQKKIVDGELEALTSSVKDIPKVLAGIVSKATHVKPEKRYQSAEEMRQALDDCLAALGGGSETKEKRVRKASTGRPSWLVPAAVGGGVLVVAVLAIAYSLMGNGSTEELRSISLNLNPPDARVLIDSRVIDNPASFDLASGSHTLSLEAAGFAPFTTTIVVTDEDKQSFTYELQPASTNPDSSNIANNIGDQNNQDGPGSTTQVTTNNTTQVTNNDSNQSNNEQSNSTTPQTDNTPAMGTISVSAVGNGTATVDGRSGSVQVPAGSSKMVSCSANGQTNSKSVSVSAGQTVNVKCYFEGRIIVSAIDADSGNAMLAAFSLNGAPQGRKNPFSANVPVGSHKVTAFLDGYTSGDVTVVLKPGIDAAPSETGRITMRKQ